MVGLPTPLGWYRWDLSQEQITNIEAFVSANDGDQLYQFLVSLRRFMEDKCREKMVDVPHDIWGSIHAYQYLIKYEKINQDLLSQFCGHGDTDLKLSQICKAFINAANFYNNMHKNTFTSFENY